MDLETEKFLLDVCQRCAKDPKFIARVIDAATHGIVEHAKNVRHHAVEMEIVASMAMNARLFGGNETFLADKLDRWRHMNGMRWDDQIMELRKRAEKKKEKVK